MSRCDFPACKCAEDNLAYGEACNLEISRQMRNWDDGNYECRCIQCSDSFTGHKRRVVCRSCQRVHDDETPIRWDIANTLSQVMGQLHRLGDADEDYATVEQIRAHVMAVREGRVTLDQFADLYMLRPQG